MKSLLPLIFAALPLMPVTSWSAPRPYALGIVIVVDQFRADYLMRFESKFLPPSANGYRSLMQKGAYFPIADHGLLQNMTGPGHAGILSGSYPYRNHISINWWFDRELGKEQYCVQDDSVKIIGSEGVVTSAKYGISPKNFNATTVGDELKNVDRPSRVVSIALKDRAAVLLGGKRADDVFWFDEKTCQWVTSEFYMKSLPDFVKKQNARINPMQKQKFSWGPYKDMNYCSKEASQTPWIIDETFKLALTAIDDMKLGNGKDTDLLTLSLSSHDYLGHHVGPNDINMEKMTLEEDRLISEFLTQVSKKLPNGLKDVFVVVTGDHGMPPTLKSIPTERLPSENIDEELAPKIIEETMTKEFGKPKGGAWIKSMSELQIYFNHDALDAANVSVSKAVAVCRKRLLKERFLDQVWGLDEILYERKIPAGEYGLAADRTLSFRSGDMILVLKPYFFSDSYPLTHMTMYSYDRFVPLIFWGKTFKPGIYRQIAHIVDIAPTLSSTLSVIPPSQSEGRIMNEILR
jgi:predicted AlkP superfamily pyrophosphatase or phosphodiesterase